MFNFFFRPQCEKVITESIIITLNIEINRNININIVAESFKIDWGDDEINSDLSHTYKENKEYEVIITGSFIMEFYARNCNISKLEFINCTELYVLECDFNQLKYLDLCKCITLGHIHCNDNKITKLKLDNLKDLEVLNCSYNQIQYLNLKKSNYLNYLNCEENKIDKLRLGDVTHLYRLKCSNNPISLRKINKNLSEQFNPFHYHALTIDSKQENSKIEKKIIKKAWYIEKKSDN